MTELTREMREQWKLSPARRLWNAVMVGLMLLLGVAITSLFALLLGATVVFADDEPMVDFELSSLELSASPVYEDGRLEGTEQVTHVGKTTLTGANRGHSR